MFPRKWTAEQLIEAVKTSYSIRQVLSKLGLREAVGNYKYIPECIKRLKLDTSHFLGQRHNKGKNFGPKRPIEDYLSNKFTILSHTLKLRLLKEGYFQHRCSSCLLDKWLSKPIPLELDHIDGNHFNNNLTNIRLLCPNCHAQTSNYRGKNKRK